MKKESNPLYFRIMKKSKKRADHYDNKLAANGSFEDIIKASVKDIKIEESDKKKPIKAAKRK